MFPQKRYYCCEKCRKVGSYEVYANGDTSFPRGEYLAHRDFIVSDFETRTEAQQWLDEHPDGTTSIRMIN